MRDDARTKKELILELQKLRKQVARLEKTKEKMRRDSLKLSKALNRSKHTRQQAIEQERLRALGEMASGIVHDFNNALTPILGASDFLLTRPNALADERQSRRLLKSIKTCAKDARDTVQRLRQFYRRDKKAVISAINVNPLIEEVVSLTERRWRDEADATETAIKIETQLGKIPLVYMNESHFRTVLTNMILNAVDAIPGSGVITLRTRATRKWLVLEVSDTGKGMTKEACRRCFEPFFSTKGKKGTGLGLAMVYGTIQSYQGQIEVETAKNKGTTFTIRLPVGSRAPKKTTRNPR